MNYQSTRFDMAGVMNKLRAIAEDNLGEKDGDMSAPGGMGDGGKEIDSAAFTRTMSRLAAIKDAVSDDNYNALRSGVRAMYMNRRPNLQQMTALLDLLETVLAYVAEDNSLFQRLKTDLSKDKAAGGDMGKEEPAAAPGTGAAEVAPEPRGLK